MTALNKQALTDEAISHAFTGTNFGRDDLRNILAETVIDAAAGWRCGYTATTICTQLGLLTPKGSASALGLRFISEHVQRETKRLKDGLEAAENNLIDSECHVAELEESLRDKQALLEALDNSLCELLPGTQYMDPPDGGSVTPLEQVRRMVADYRNQIAELEARTPYGYLRQCDGQIQISIGSERPHDRSGGYATPWFAIY
ncbi:hypothetical protein ACSS9A_004399, partial [Salmonella enterica subsp. enterica serovar Newport]